MLGAIAVAAELVVMVGPLLRGDRGARSGEGRAHRYGLPAAWGRLACCNATLFTAGIVVFFIPSANDPASCTFADECWFTPTEKIGLALGLLAVGLFVLGAAILGIVAAGTGSTAHRRIIAAYRADPEYADDYGYTHRELQEKHRALLEKHHQAQG